VTRSHTIRSDPTLVQNVSGKARATYCTKKMMTSEVVSLNSSTVKVTERGGQHTAATAHHTISDRGSKANSGLPATQPRIAPLRVCCRCLTCDGFIGLLPSIVLT